MSEPLEAKKSSLEQKADEAEFQMPRWKANFWYIILWVTMLLDMIDRQAVNAVLPILKKEFALTDAQGGFVGSIVGLTMALLVFPVSVLCDRWSRRKMVSIMVACWSVATYITGIAKSYQTLLLGRLAVGVGEAGYGPAAFALISAWYPKKLRGTMLGMFHAATPIGHAVGIALAGYIAYHYGWRTVFGILAVPGLILAVLLWFLPDFKAKKVEEGSEKEVKTSLKEVLSYIFHTKTVLTLFLIGVSVFIVQNTFQIWGVTYFVRTFGMNVKEAGAVIGMVGLLSFMGAPFAGWLGDRLLRYTTRGRMVVALILAILFMVFMILALNSKEYNYVFAFWTIAWFCMPGIQISAYTAMQDLVPPYCRGIAFAFVPICNQLLVGVWAPMVAGLMSDKFGLNYSLQVITGTSFVLTIFFVFLAMKFYNRDLQRIEALGTFKLDRG